MDRKAPVFRHRHPRFAIAIRIQCPAPDCGAVCSTADAATGRSVKCPKCGRNFIAQATLDGQSSDTRKSRPVSGGNPFPELPAEFGRYRVLKLLGRGGMGAVYLAQDSQLGRQVALKIPFFDATKGQRLERFAREARAAAALHHPNICTVFDVGDVGGRPFLTMAYLPGTPLEQQIGTDVLMPQTRAAEIVRQVARALAYAHGTGIVHRDLKPANIMIRPDGEPVVMDFGLAKHAADTDPNASRLTQDGAILGTPTYMSPEQVRADATIGPASDIYALGVVLFEALTGAPPYTGALGAVMAQVLASPVPVVREFRADVDPRLDAICQRALAKSPGDRFPSMAALADALDAYLKASTAPAPLPEPVPQPSRAAPAVLSVSTPLEFDEPDEEPAPPRTPARTASATKTNWRRRAALAAFAIPLCIWLGVVVLRVETANGTLVVEIDDPAVEARIKNGKLILSGPDGKVRYTLSPGERNKTIDAGAYKVRVEGADGLALDTSEFTLKKGDKVTVRVTMEPKAVAKKEPNKESNKPVPIAEVGEFVSLFNGTDLTEWITPGGAPADWEVKDGYFAVGGSGDIRTKKEFGPDLVVRLEFWLPSLPAQRGQGRANSGVFIHGRYEIQILDCYMNETFANGTVGSLYGIIAADGDALKKAVRQPETWNAMEITFHSPRFDAQGVVRKSGRVTVVLNGVTVISDSPFDAPTPGGVGPAQDSGPIRLQNHGNKVRFRNIEIKDLRPAPPGAGGPALVNEPWLHFPGGDGPGNGKKVVLVCGEEEYRSEEVLPALAEILAKHHGFDCTVLFSIDPKDGTIQPNVNNNIPGLDKLNGADLLVLFARFRDLPDDQMRHVVAYVESGKPIIGLRNATHAFQLSSATYNKYSWDGKANSYDGGFGRQVLGETWVGHHGNHGKEGTRGVFAPGQQTHPILKGIEVASIFGTSDVYTVNLPRTADVTPLVYGEVTESLQFDSRAVGGKKNDPMMPVAWTKRYRTATGNTARVFTTTMGCAEDLGFEGTRRMLVNACYWAVGAEDKIPDKAKVDFVREYKPSRFAVKNSDAWKPGRKPIDLLK